MVMIILVLFLALTFDSNSAMKHISKKLICLSLLIFVSFISGCKDDEPKQLTVVSTIGMIHDVVKNIAGDKVNAIGLMGPGVDPHLYKASQGDVTHLSNADLIFYNGLHLEAKMIDIFEKMSKTKLTIAVTQGIPESKLTSHPDYEGFHDPHVWFDVNLWILATKEITKGLIQLDPKNKDFFTKNETEYITKLQELNTWIITQIASIPTQRRLLVTAHDAFGYFGNAYNFRVVGLQGISTASEAGTKDIQRVTRVIIDNEIPTIFIESSVPIRHIQALQASVQSKGREVTIGHELFTDAMGDANTIEGTYIGMVRYNVTQIVNGLK